MVGFLREGESSAQATVQRSNGAAHPFDEEAVKLLVLEWQCDQRPELLGEILRRTECVITGVILSRSTYFEDLAELVNLLRTRIWKKLPGYDPEHGEGRIFTYVTMVVQQGLTDIWSKKTRYKQRYMAADLSLLDHIQYSKWDGVFSYEIREEIEYRKLQIRTTCTDPGELKAQRWLVNGLIESEFKLRRHQAANSLVIGHGIEFPRSRVLHDITVLEMRRQLLDIMKIRRITVADLRGTRAIALAKYANRLLPEDFSKLCFLMKGLAPVIIEKGRIDWILHGFPQSRLLFEPGTGIYSLSGIGS